MHVIAYHIPFFVEKHGCFKKFTGQGVEKIMMMRRRLCLENQINGMLQRIFSRKKAGSGILKKEKERKVITQKEIMNSGSQMAT